VYGKRKKIKSGTWYSIDCMTQTHNQKRFTISEVAADWHELMIPAYHSALCVHLYLAVLMPANSWVHGAVNRSTTAPICYTRPLPYSHVEH